MCTIAGAKVQLNYNCYNVYFNGCLLFFGIHAANVVHLAERMAEQEQAKAA